MSAVIVRADASPAMGTGHVMRCLALAAALASRGARVRFVVAEAGPTLEARVEDGGHTLTRLGAVRPGGADDLDATVAAARADSARVAVVDGYHFDERYQAGLRASVGRLVQVDDLAEAVGVADVVVNHGAHADAARYRGKTRPSARLLLGPRYALLRDEFRAARDRLGAVRPDRGRLLVTMGGADPDDVTGRVVEALGLVPDAPPATVVVGAAYRHLDRLRGAVETAAGDVTVEVDVRSMADLMSAAGMAIAGAGGTVWELCCLGVPMLLVALAANQMPIARRAASLGVAVDLGWHADVDAKRIAAAVTALAADGARREAMALRAGALVDGLGALRAAEAITEAMESSHDAD